MSFPEKNVYRIAKKNKKTPLCFIRNVGFEACSARDGSKEGERTRNSSEQVHKSVGFQLTTKRGEPTCFESFDKLSARYCPKGMIFQKIQWTITTEKKRKSY